MALKDKVFHLDTAFAIKKLPDSSEDGPIFIEGYASTNDMDRAGDVVPSTVWEKGVTNYLKNPIILAQHNHKDPIGRMVEHKIDPKGLWIKAKISKAASVYDLVKDEVLTAFSIGFRILDAEWNSAAEVFLIKDLELLEISVVSVPCNQDTLFNLSKSFDSSEEFNEYKSLFIKDDSAKETDNQKNKGIINIKDTYMDPKELERIVAEASTKAAQAAADAATKRITDKLAAEKAAQELAEAAKLAKETEIKAAVEAATKSAIEVTQSGAEKLLAEVTKRLEDESKTSAKALEDLRGVLAEKAGEIEALRKARPGFSDKGTGADGLEYSDKEKAVLLSVMSNKSLKDTKFGKDLLEKALGAGAAVGAHLPSQTWEHEVSMNMESEVRRKLVVVPLFRAIDMKTNIMSFPLNPEAGIATWVTNAQFGTTNSPGAAQTHQLKEVTLNAFKVSTAEYLTFEEEEDSLIAILPIVRDAMVRRVARAMDRAYLLGAGAGADPVKGVAIYDATSVVTPTNTGAASVANLRALRKDLGAWGLDPSELTFVVSTDVYYDLLDDTLFQTVDKVGDKATLLKGQIGSIGNSPVLVSDQFPTKAGGANNASTNIGAICVAPGNFLAGNQRGLRFDTQDLVETQRRVLVSSLRTGMTQVTTNLGQGVSTLRWS